MTTDVALILSQARQLTPDEQLELLQGVAALLHQQLTHPTKQERRVAPIRSLDELAADFWPEDESADAINAYIAAQRAADRERDV
jgi:hypothetical protein